MSKKQKKGYVQLVWLICKKCGNKKALVINWEKRTFEIKTPKQN